MLKKLSELGSNKDFLNTTQKAWIGKREIGQLNFEKHSKKAKVNLEDS